MNINSIRTYSELCSLETFDERFDYLKLPGSVGKATFGYDRIFNQQFYSSSLWRKTRRDIIIRDNACDLALPGYELNDRIMIHHMNPITKRNILDEDWEYLTNPEYLICVSFNTHQAIHYGDRNLLPKPLVERMPGDTCPWR